MSIEAYLAFTAATIILLMIPGPTILLVVSYALGQGWRTALPVAIGVALGDLTAMTLSLFGVGAVLQASALLFTALKWIGAGYLIYLGVTLWRSGAALDVRNVTDKKSSLKMLGHAWLVTALNPKGITFFVAFVPQFINHDNSFVQQAVIFELTFMVLAFTNALGYAFVAARARQTLSNPQAMKWLNRTGGCLLVGAGVATVALAKQS